MDQQVRLITKVNHGAKINRNLFAPLGIIISFKINLKPSAKGCRIPYHPTILGPLRR
jgi:hypothetical protein